MKHSHFDCIGFKIKKDDDLVKMIDLTRPHLQIAENRAKSGFQLLYYNDEQGVQMFYTLKNNEIYGLNPHFYGEIVHDMAINELIVDESGDIIARAWLNPDESLTDGIVPLFFSFPNGFFYKREKMPYLAPIQLTAFAEDYKVYPTENKLMDKLQKMKLGEFEGKELSFATDYFIPVGTFQEEESIQLNALVQFAGEIESVNLLTNSLSKQPFYHLKVASMIRIDVVLPKIKGENIKQGQFIEGIFWLSGIRIKLKNGYKHG